MALIDPCVALPFEPKGGRRLADEREASDRDDDQPLTPTTPTTPPPDSADMTPAQPAAVPALSPSAATASSSSSSPAPSVPQSPPSAPAHLLQSVQSVLSLFFTDHQQQSPSSSQQLLAASAASVQSPSALSFGAALSSSTVSSPQSGTASYSPSSLHSTSPAVLPLSPSSSHASLSAAKAPGRHCAILDLDETLLHSFFPDKVTPYQYQYMALKCKQQEDDERAGRLSQAQRTLYQVDVGDGTIVVLMLRPHLRPFLQSLFAHYDVGVWSAGGKLYVDAICRVLFPAESPYRPQFQLCWDDVQVETNGLSSYTKPLTTLISRFAHLQLDALFLVDNRKENGLHFPAQLVIAPDYLPRPWEWNGERDRDGYLMDAMQSIHECVHSMRQRGAEGVLSAGRVSAGLSRASADGAMALDVGEEDSMDDEDDSDMGLDDDGGAEAEAGPAGEAEDDDEDESEMDDETERSSSHGRTVTDFYIMCDDVGQQRRAARRSQQKSAA